MEVKATMVFDDKTVVVDTRVRHKIKFSKYLEFNGTWTQEITVERYFLSHYGCGLIEFEHEGGVHTVNMAVVDMIVQVKPT